MIPAVTSIGPGLVSEPGVQTRTDLATAAHNFEALLVGELLRSVREAGSGGWLGTGDDNAGMQAMEIAQEQFASAIAAGGGMGIAQMALKSLNVGPVAKSP